MTVYYSDIFPSFLRTSKINFARNTAHRCPVQTEFRGTPPSFTRASFSKVSHFERERALKVKVQTIAHAHHARIGGSDLLRTVSCTDSGSIDTINGLGWETLQFSAGAAVLWAGPHTSTSSHARARSNA